MSGIFISYRQDDTKPWALLLCKELADVFGEDRVFLDKDALRAGSWRAQIHEALNQCGVVLVVIGRRWLTLTDETGRRRLDHSDDVHRQEIAMALSRGDVTIIPVLVDGVRMPRAADLPAEIRSLTEQQSRELSDIRARRSVDIQLLIEDIQRITGLKRRPKDDTSVKRGPQGSRLAICVGTALTISALSLAVWVFFYVAFPGTPLTAGETIVVLSLCALVVLSARRIWVRRHNRNEGFQQ